MPQRNASSDSATRSQCGDLQLQRASHSALSAASERLERFKAGEADSGPKSGGAKRKWRKA